MLKIFQVRLQQYVNGELPDVQPGFRNGRGTRAGSSKKQESSRKTSISTLFIYLLLNIYLFIFISALLTMPKPLTVWITINWAKF